MTQWNDRMKEETLDVKSPGFWLATFIEVWPFSCHLFSGPQFLCFMKEKLTLDFLCMWSPALKFWVLKIWKPVLGPAGPEGAETGSSCFLDPLEEYTRGNWDRPTFQLSISIMWWSQTWARPRLGFKFQPLHFEPAQLRTYFWPFLNLCFSQW